MISGSAPVLPLILHLIMEPEKGSGMEMMHHQETTNIFLTPIFKYLPRNTLKTRNKERGIAVHLPIVRSIS
jgi:hypothetical protein